MIEVKEEKQFTINYRKLKAGLIQLLLFDFSASLDPWEMLSNDYRIKIQNLVCALLEEHLNFRTQVDVKFDLEKPEIHINVYLKLGKHSAVVYTSDLSPEYVHINGKYT